VQHECIFHAIQNALRQMTKVYGRHYQEKIPETAPLHEAITLSWLESSSARKTGDTALE